jgi:hypothetical protein
MVHVDIHVPKHDFCVSKNLGTRVVLENGMAGLAHGSQDTRVEFQKL